MFGRGGIGPMPDGATTGLPPSRREIERLRKVDNKGGLQLSMAGLLSMAFGTTARLTAHLRYGVKTSARRVGIHRRRTPR
jgi:hypothetical protein